MATCPVCGGHTSRHPFIAALQHFKPWAGGGFSLRQHVQFHGLRHGLAVWAVMGSPLLYSIRNWPNRGGALVNQCEPSASDEPLLQCGAPLPNRRFICDA